LIAHTTSPRGSRFEIEGEVNFLRAGVFDVQNMVAVSYAKLIRKLGVLTPEQLSAIEEVIRLWLGLQ
jgi:mRNA interferase MazF